jgi:hypothetical protein
VAELDNCVVLADNRAVFANNRVNGIVHNRKKSPDGIAGAFIKSVVKINY